jgi:hypothetical protein
LASRVVDWGHMRAGITNAFDQIHKNPVASAVVSTALSSIPVFGSFLGKVYENAPGSSEDKGGAVLQLLRNLQSLTDEKLQQVTEAAEANQQVLLANHDALTKLVALTGDVAKKLEEVRAGQLTLEEGDKRIEEAVEGLAKQDIELRHALQANQERVDAEFDDVKKLIRTSLGSAGTTGGSQPAVDALLKQSTLIQVEAGERVADAVQQNRARIQSEIQAAMVTRSRTAEQILAEYIDAQSRTKLQEALSLIQQAEHQDPSNVDALLQNVQVLAWLDPRDKATRWKLMNRAVALLGVPANDRERLQLAQATLYRAVNSDPIDLASVGMARTIFQELGRNEYVQQIDMLMGGSQVAPSPAGAAGNVPSLVGRWNIQSGNGNQSVIDMYPDGTFQGVLQQGWVRHALYGQWAFNQYTGTIDFQGLVDNSMPFVNRFVIQGVRGNAFFGIDATGTTFVMSRG